MFKNNSIFIKVLYNNLLITLIPLVIVISVICFLLCANVKDNEVQLTQKAVDDYADKVKSEIILAMQTSENILKYNYLIDHLNSRNQSTAEKLSFSNNFTAYMDNITSSLHYDSILVYFDDSEVFENKYLLNVSRLAHAQAILEYFKNANTNIAWDDTIRRSENDEEAYFTFYREMALNPGSILSGRVYIPKPPAELDVHMIKRSEFTGDKSCITASINQAYIVAAPLNRGKINRMYLRYILLFAALCLCFFITLVWLAYKITLRVTSDVNAFIAKLSEQDVLMAEDINLIPTFKDPMELTVIKNTIGKLMRRVKAASDLQHKSELAKRKVELELLQSKIEPHILYNSLSVIKLKAFQYNEKDTEISNIIHHLTCYYRSVLSKGKKYVTVAEELEMLRHYLFINEISHGKTYHFTADIPSEAENREILHLLLQPFVENAIVHGLSGKRQSCEIKISCQYTENTMKFTIYDNGYGISPAALAQLNNPDSAEGGYGIKNVRQRLRLEYGAHCSVSFSSKENAFTKAVIEFETK